MKEKLKKYAKILAKIILIVLPLFVIIHEGYGLYIDNYNFQQFEKVKVILKDLKRTDKQFFYLNEFNEIYNVNIQPVKNCYFLRNYMTDDRVPYTFAFLFASWFNKTKYKSEFFIYPKYDIPYWHLCYNNRCVDGNFESFDGVISKPCRERRK